MLEDLVATGRDHRLLFECVRAGGDLRTLMQDRERAGRPARFLPQDLYADAQRCLAELRRRGHIVGVAGNQSLFEEDVAKGLGLDVDISRPGNEWEFEKPDPRFFERLVAEAAVAPSEVVYVGDRVDNDILPAKAIGLRTVLVTTGPWGRFHATLPDATEADVIVDSLAEVPDAIGRL